MDIGSLLLIVALLIFVGLFIGRPLLERKSVSVSQEERDFSSLLAERDRILNALLELDFDFSLGKIPEQDYPIQREIMLQKGANVLRQIDERASQTKDEDVEALIEAAIAARRATHGRRPSSMPAYSRGTTTDNLETVPQPAGQAVAVSTSTDQDDELEARIAARRRSRQDKSAGFCPQCGNPLQKSDRFCPKCGFKLE